jgi:hypothetical protein
MKRWASLLGANRARAGCAVGKASKSNVGRRGFVHSDAHAHEVSSAAARAHMRTRVKHTSASGRSGVVAAVVRPTTGAQCTPGTGSFIPSFRAPSRPNISQKVGGTETHHSPTTDPAPKNKRAFRKSTFVVQHVPGSNIGMGWASSNLAITDGTMVHVYRYPQHTYCMFPVPYMAVLGSTGHCAI